MTSPQRHSLRLWVALALLLACPLDALWGQAGLKSDILARWKTVGRVRVLWPPKKAAPKAVIHWIGGFLVGRASDLTYNDLLEYLADKGYIICATAIPLVTLKHGEAAASCAQDFQRAYRVLSEGSTSVSALPVIGMSHSLGGKLTALIASTTDIASEGAAAPRMNAVNIFLAFNNYAFAAAGKNGEQSSNPGPSPSSGPKQQEFTPSAAATWRQIASAYSVPRSLAVRFEGDTIDQSAELLEALCQRQRTCGDASNVQASLLVLPGDHLTPNRRDIGIFALLVQAIDGLVDSSST